MMLLLSQFACMTLLCAGLQRKPSVAAGASQFVVRSSSGALARMTSFPTPLGGGSSGSGWR